MFTLGKTHSLGGRILSEILNDWQFAAPEPLPGQNMSRKQRGSNHLPSSYYKELGRYIWATFELGDKRNLILKG